jgi:enoyl-CoA hydratase
MPEEIDVDRRGEIEIVTINRPDARNALTRKTYQEIEAAVRETQARCLIVTAVDPAFCSGDDVKQLMGGGRTSGAPTVAPRLTPAADALLYTDVPVIAAVNGAAVGWGMELALMADLRIASTRARFGELFVKRGLCCDVPGLARLAGLIGRERAAEMLFSGRIIDADEAERIGLVSRVVEHDALIPAALELAETIAGNPPLAVQRLKAGLRKAIDPDWRDLGAWVGESLGELFQTEDHREGVRAFLEKRAPHYVGR